MKNDKNFCLYYYKGSKITVEDFRLWLKIGNLMSFFSSFYFPAAVEYVRNRIQEGTYRDHSGGKRKCKIRTRLYASSVLRTEE